jgi:hypothetical protein
MSPVPVYQQKGTNYAFSVYDKNHNLMYSKYTFNFDLYRLDNSTEFSKSSSKNDIFYHFLMKNDTDLNKPFDLKPAFVKYFNPMTPDVVAYHDRYGYCMALNYMQIVNIIGEVSVDVILEHQFELIQYTDDNIRRLQDYIYYENNNDDPDFDLFYTKYNFDFDSYKRDWNVWSIKNLPVFTDFVFRTQYLNNTIIGSPGYGKPIDDFKKYFFQNVPGLEDYLLKNSVTSLYSRVSNSYPNIDWINYKKENSDLTYTTLYGLQEHYLEYGQFELRNITFHITTSTNVITEKTRSTVTVLSNNKYTKSGSGLLYNGSTYNVVNGKKCVYLITCYHLIKDSHNKNTINAKVNYFDSAKNKQISNILSFQIIGYDIFTDVLIGLYDPTLDYNKEFNSNLNIDSIPVIDIDGNVDLEKNTEVYTIGNIGDIDTNAIISGKLINKEYRGNYKSSFYFGIPDSYLINFISEGGMSGSPIFIDNNDSCIGMLVGSVGENSQYTVALSGYYLSIVVLTAINKWHKLPSLYDTTNINNLNFFIRDVFPKKWLGVVCKYNDGTSTIKELANFNNHNGLIVTNFIIGFNKNNFAWIYNILDLENHTNEPINTPLLDTKMYKRFLNNNRVPIIIESILCFENVESDFDNFTFGLNHNQYGYNIITYDLSQIASFINDPKYKNRERREFPQLSITYFYYNGNTWIKDTEVVGGNTPDWYNEYKTASGELIYQHRFEYPETLIPYTCEYISSFGGTCQGQAWFCHNCNHALASSRYDITDGHQTWTVCKKCKNDLVDQGWTEK